MKEETSLTKRVTNRQNAQKSTGPKTDKGKAIAKMNALKHGLLAREVVVTEGEVKESRRQFDVLLDALRQDLAPDGPLEGMLVERVAVCYWRLRRVLIAEGGEISLRANVRNWRDYQMKRIEDFLELRDAEEWEHSEEDFLKTGIGCAYVIEELNQVRSAVEQCGELPEEVLRTVENHLGRDGHTTAPLRVFFAMLTDNPQGLEPEALKIKHRELVLKYTSERIQQVQDIHKEAVEEVEELEDKAMNRAGCVPSAETMERLARYETHLERQLYRALNQLERLQRQRRGEAVPPPLSLEVNTTGG